MRLWHQLQAPSQHTSKSKLTIQGSKIKETKVREGDAAPGPGSGGKWGCTKMTA